MELRMNLSRSLWGSVQNRFCCATPIQIGHGAHIMNQLQDRLMTQQHAMLVQQHGWQPWCSTVDS